MMTGETSPVHTLAHAALRCLSRAGAARAAIALPSGVAAEVAWRGPVLPPHIPDTVADYETVRLQEARWAGAHRLVVRAPLLVLDLAWNTDEPIRIMTFCRGDWERELLEALA